MENQDPVRVKSLRGQNSEIRCLELSPDMKQAVSGSQDSQIFVWNFKADARPFKFQDHKGYVAATVFSNNGKYIASGNFLNSGGEDKIVRIWKNSANIKFSKISGHSAPIRSLQFSNDDNLILTGSNDKSVRIYQTKQKMNFVKSYLGHTNWVTSCQFSPSNTLIISGSDDNTMRIWDTETQKSQVKFLNQIFHDHQSALTSVKFLGQENFVASSDKNGKIKIWDLRVGQCVQHYEAHIGQVGALSVHPNGIYLNSVGRNDNLTKIWDLRQGILNLTIQSHQQGVNCIDYSKDGEFFATGGVDKMVMIWKSNIQNQLSDSYLQQNQTPLVQTLEQDQKNFTQSQGDQNFQNNQQNDMQNSNLSYTQQQEYPFQTGTQISFQLTQTQQQTQLEPSQDTNQYTSCNEFKQNSTNLNKISSLQTMLKKIQLKI